MTKEELAAQLNGNEYRAEISKELSAAAKAASLLVIYGASDDLMEFDGAIRDEVGAYGGTTVLIDQKGPLPDRDSIDDDEDLETFFSRRKTALTIDALWCAEPDYSWTFKTDIPHATFDIFEDGEPYCRGIVIAISDLPAA